MNTKTEKEKDIFLENIIEWFGYVDNYGDKTIWPGSIIDRTAEASEDNEKSYGEKLIDFFENIIGGNFEDHNYVIIKDDHGNQV